MAGPLCITGVGRRWYCQLECCAFSSFIRQYWWGSSGLMVFHISITARLVCCLCYDERDWRTKDHIRSRLCFWILFVFLNFFFFLFVIVYLLLVVKRRRLGERIKTPYSFGADLSCIQPTFLLLWGWNATVLSLNFFGFCFLGTRGIWIQVDTHTTIKLILKTRVSHADSIRIHGDWALIRPRRTAPPDDASLES